MSLQIADMGEVVYGGAVTAATWWDNKRITEATLLPKEILKKASFYTYVGVGLVATLMTTFGWMRRYDAWTERIAHGFLYDLPRFAYDLQKTLSAAGNAGGSGSRAVQEAQQILRRQLASGAVRTEQTTKPQFENQRSY